MEDVISLDNNLPITSSKNTTSNISTPITTTLNKKYKVVLSTLTKIVIDIDGNGALYSPTQFTKTLTIGDEVELPKEEGN